MRASRACVSHVPQLAIFLTRISHGLGEVVVAALAQERPEVVTAVVIDVSESDENGSCGTSCRLMSSAQVGRRLGLASARVRALRREGRLPASRTPVGNLHPVAAVEALEHERQQRKSDANAGQDIISGILWLYSELCGSTPARASSSTTKRPARAAFHCKGDAVASLEATQPIPQH
jgi:hypothetical protein